MSPHDRRSLLAAALAATALPAAGLDGVDPIARALGQPRHYLDRPMIDQLRNQLDACKAEDGADGPAVVLPMVLAILGIVHQHAAAVTADCGEAR
jgi:hypothetical protein